MGLTMIKRITLENWKSFRQATLHIAPLTVIIGTSASGKTNAVEALAFLGRMSRGQNIRETFAGDEGQNGIRGGAESITFKPADYFTLDVTIQGIAPENPSSYLYHLTVEPAPYLVAAEQLSSVADEQGNAPTTDMFIDMNVDKEKHLANAAYENKGIVGRIDRMVELSGLYTSLGRMEERLPGEVRGVCQTLQHIYVLDPVAALMRSPSLIGNVSLNSNGSNIAAVIAGKPPNQQQKIEAALSFYASHLPEGNIRRVFAKKVGKPLTHALLFAKEQWLVNEPPTLMDARTMSDGTLRFLAILTAMLTHPSGSLVVIENIDYGLHASRACLLIHMIRHIGEQRNINIIITTHNPDLVNEMTQEEQDHLPLIQVIHRNLTTGESKITILEDHADLPRLLETLSPEREAARSAIRRGIAHSRREH